MLVDKILFLPLESTVCISVSPSLILYVRIIALLRNNIIGNMYTFAILSCFFNKLYCFVLYCEELCVLFVFIIAICGAVLLFIMLSTVLCCVNCIVLLCSNVYCAACAIFRVSLYKF